MTADLLPLQFKALWEGIANDPNLNWHDSEVFVSKDMVMLSEVYNYKTLISNGISVLGERDVQIMLHNTLSTP